MKSYLCWIQECTRPILWPEAHLIAATLDEKDEKKEQCLSEQQQHSTTDEGEHDSNDDDDVVSSNAADSRPTMSNEVSFPEVHKAKPMASFQDHCTVFVSAMRAYLMALACIYLISGDATYPAYGAASQWSWTWMWPLLVRNILATWLIAGGWDYYLYLSPLHSRLHKYKINPSLPSFRQLKHDFCMTTMASVCGTLVEWVLCRGYATQYHGSMYLLPSASITIQFPDPFDTNPSHVWTLLLAVTLVHWRDVHFFCMHRLLHPWNVVPRYLDGGYVLYKYVHSLHHKSYNPTALSGTSMHPVEATLYYSAALMPFFSVKVGSYTLCLDPTWVHPAIPLGVIVDCGIAAWLGHSGYDWPGTGDIYHHLHHACFDCNYGGPLMPFDYYVLGTFASCKADLPKIWARKRSSKNGVVPKVGMEGNMEITKVHFSSNAADHVE